MKKILLILALVFCPLVYAQAPKVPHLINFQSVLTDPAGNPLASGLYNVHFRILDPNGAELYQETQAVEADKGAVSTMVGNRGDLSLDQLDPKRSYFLGVSVDGQGQEKKMEIAAVPYSFYAEQALTVAPKSIGAEAIEPHSITADLLAENVLSTLLTGMQAGGLPSVVVSRSELNGVGGANQIGVNSGFIYSGSSTVQAVLKDLDSTIHQRRLITDRQIQTVDGRVTTLDGRVTTEVSRLDGVTATKVSKSGDIMTGELNMSGQAIRNAGPPSGESDVARLSDISNALRGAGPAYQLAVNPNGSMPPPGSELNLTAGIVAGVNVATHNHDGPDQGGSLPFFMRPFAFVSFGRINSGCPIQSAYNVAGTQNINSDLQWCRITYATPIGCASSPIVLVTPMNIDDPDGTPGFSYFNADQRGVTVNLDADADSGASVVVFLPPGC